MAEPLRCGKLTSLDAQKSAKHVNRGPIGNHHNKTAAQAISWASLASSCGRFHELRGVNHKKHKWNGVIGSATGDFLSRKGYASSIEQSVQSVLTIIEIRLLKWINDITTLHQTCFITHLEKNKFLGSGILTMFENSQESSMNGL